MWQQLCKTTKCTGRDTAGAYDFYVGHNMIIFDIILFFTLVFFIRRWTSVDPHNAQKSDGVLKHAVFSLLLTICYFFLYQFDKKNSLPLALSSFIIYSVYMPAINPPTSWRKDEFDSLIQGLVESKKIQFGGTAIIKLLCLLMAIIFVGNFSHYWLLIFVVFGIGIQFGKSLTLNLLIQADEGEWKDIKDYQKQDRLMRKYSTIMKGSVLSFFFFSFYYGLEIVAFAELNPKNWNSYFSIISGFLVGMIIESLTE
jgi:hypothetical protein